MKKVKLTIVLSMVVIAAISAAVIVDVITPDVVFINSENTGLKTTYINPMWTPTDPKYFGDDDYLDGIVATYIGKVDPYTLRDDSDLIITGKIIRELHEYDMTTKSTPDEPAMRVIKYDINVSDVNKGTYGQNTIHVVTYVQSNLDFQLDDTVLVMAMTDNTLDHIEPIAGPHAMFKIINNDLIGHEKTLALSDLFLEK